MDGLIKINGLQTPDFLKIEFKKDFELVNGIHVIRGSNGIGKSVFLKSIIGMYGVYPGVTSIRTNGTRSALISYFDQNSSCFSASFQENLFFESKNVPFDKITEAKSYIADFGLSAIGNDLQKIIIPNTLSGGQTKKIGLIRATLRSADLYLFDEPFNDLDGSSKLKFIDILRDLAKISTVILIIHGDLDQIKFNSLDIFE